MNTLHENCGGIIIRWGGRRRRCGRCKATWSMWKRRRGRRRKRVAVTLVHQYVRRELPSLSIAAQKRAQSKDQLQRSLKQSREFFVTDTQWPTIYSGNRLIVIADAVMVHAEKRIYTFYLLLLRPVDGNRAIITKPYIQEGKESWQGWQYAFQELPREVHHSITALICDGHRGLYSVARQNKWHIQLCIFHILAKIQGRRSRWAYSRHRGEGSQLYQLLKTVLTSISEQEVLSALLGLAEVRAKTKSPQLKRYLSGFEKSYHLYRTYLIHPELHLPRTSNSAEALIRMIRALLSRAHGFRTKDSLIQWIEALLKSKQTIACNGFLPTELIR